MGHLLSQNAQEAPLPEALVTFKQESLSQAPSAFCGWFSPRVPPLAGPAWKLVWEGDWPTASETEYRAGPVPPGWVRSQGACRGHVLVAYGQANFRPASSAEEDLKRVLLSCEHRRTLGCPRSSLGF